jgi:hypothetical protein
LDGIVTGSGDIWEPPVLGEHGRDENFDADRDRTRFDTRMRDFISQFQGVCVRKITTDHAGGFRLCIGRSNVLEVFPVNSQDIDCWRLFRPGNTTEHFVVTGVRTIGPSEIALAEQLSHQEGNSV